MQSLESLPTWLSDYWSISLESAQIILSLTVIVGLLLPVLYLTRGRGLVIPAMTFFLAEALCVGLGWLSYWVMIATLCVLALLIAKVAAGTVTGG